ncbi:UDP-N-acetylglucosamine 1-carboxyvinyltransferase [Candidatus Cerribacteria bacterium 'Amazon FNV 2010 28 9']|uniref:UDP-N-acetylglucosamine 1-carboxyvinyltransferase n=1 Tax=Candidatus Cerribacteria bacterium 'Amazon FNV 2010 28 9' TaxID=2081795 RepID=A0A317JQ28_9BACT|nr:MAG: UDP-N-acetylglucosamine 1-carboxyvinyltransferase [Candidatus Cerribacteria bacterium 'Amazon FNV 2010 28 9']
MSTYHIAGGTPLFGSVRLGGAKNASFKLMIASLLADSPSRLLNFSHISDVEMVARLITSLGGKATEIGDRAYVIDPRSFHSHVISASTAEVSRASTMFIPALVARFGKAIVPFPGGDKIGNRPLERHFDGLKALGMNIRTEGNAIVVDAQELQGTTYRFEKNTHTGTETLIMAAVKAKGKTRLENVALETEIDDLIRFLNQMGAKITRLPDRVIEIEGVDHLSGAIHTIMPDQNQAVSYACAALATQGDVIVEGALSNSLESFLKKLDDIGAGYEVGNFGIRFFYKGELRATDVTTEPAPGFKTDWQPLWVTMMTQATGVSILHETVYESRFAYADALKEMGASIEFFNPSVNNPDEVYNFNLADEKLGAVHAARILGPSHLHGGEFTVKDLRHGATLMIAGLIAAGETILHDPEHQIDRGYEKLHEKLVKMGAKIEVSD